MECHEDENEKFKGVVYPQCRATLRRKNYMSATNLHNTGPGRRRNPIQYRICHASCYSSSKPFEHICHSWSCSIVPSSRHSIYYFNQNLQTDRHRTDGGMDVVIIMKKIQNSASLEKVKKNRYYSEMKTVSVLFVLLQVGHSAAVEKIYGYLNTCLTIAFLPRQGAKRKLPWTNFWWLFLDHFRGRASQ